MTLRSVKNGHYLVYKESSANRRIRGDVPFNNNEKFEVVDIRRELGTVALKAMMPFFQDAESGSGDMNSTSTAPEECYVGFSGEKDLASCFPVSNYSEIQILQSH